MFPWREETRAVAIICHAVECSGNRTFPGDNFVPGRNYDFKTYPASILPRSFQNSSRYAQAVPDRNVIFPDKFSCATGHSVLHDRYARARLDSSFGTVIGHKTKREALQRDAFGHRPKAALPKDRFTFAIEDPIAGVGYFQNAAEQIRFESSTVDPRRTRDNQQSEFHESDESRKRKPPQIMIVMWAVFLQMRRNRKQASGNQHEPKGKKRKIILPGHPIPGRVQNQHVKAMQNQQIDAACEKDKPTSKGDYRPGRRADNDPRKVNRQPEYERENYDPPSCVSFSINMRDNVVLKITVIEIAPHPTKSERHGCRRKEGYKKPRPDTHPRCRQE